MVLEHDGAGNRLQRYVHLDGADTPVLSYNGTETSPRQLMPDHLGSIVSMTQHGWSRIVVNTYDEYGYPAATNTGRFQYTGQAWIAELGLYYYKAQMYSPGMGRFLQTDPIGYGDGLNWHNYVGGDPVNRRDPDGLQGCEQYTGIARAGCEQEMAKAKAEEAKPKAEECAKNPDCVTIWGKYPPKPSNKPPFLPPTQPDTPAPPPIPAPNGSGGRGNESGRIIVCDVSPSGPGNPGHCETISPEDACRRAVAVDSALGDTSYALTGLSLLTKIPRHLTLAIWFIRGHAKMQKWAYYK